MPELFTARGAIEPGSPIDSRAHGPLSARDHRQGTAPSIDATKRPLSLMTTIWEPSWARFAAGPSLARHRHLVPKRRPDAVVADRDSANACSITRHTSRRMRPTSSFKHAEPANARRLVPDEGLVAQIHASARWRGLADSAHDQPRVADGGRISGRVARQQRQGDQGLPLQADWHLGNDVGFVLFFAPLESDQVAAAVQAGRDDTVVLSE